MALNFLGIPTAMTLSVFFLKIQYTKLHFIGVAISLLGLILVISSDILQQNDDNSSKFSTVSMFFGDLMAFFGTVFLSTYFLEVFSYTRSNVLQEKALSLVNYDQALLLGPWGIIGVLITTIEGLILKEFRYLRGMKHFVNFFYLAGFAITDVLAYELIPTFIGKYSAALFNLSNLATPIYASFLQHFLFNLAWVFFNL